MLAPILFNLFFDAVNVINVSLQKHPGNGVTIHRRSVGGRGAGGGGLGEAIAPKHFGRVISLQAKL